MAWSSLGSVNASGSFQSFDTALLNDELVRIEVSLLGENVFNLKRIDFIESYAGGLTRFALSLPVRQLSIIEPFTLPPLFFENGFGLRDLQVKHNKLGLADTTVIFIEAFNWVTTP